MKVYTAGKPLLLALVQRTYRQQENDEFFLLPGSWQPTHHSADKRTLEGHQDRSENISEKRWNFKSSSAQGFTFSMSKCSKLILAEEGKCSNYWASSIKEINF